MINENNQVNKYNVSIILPYYKKFNEFKYALEYNYKQFESVNEVIIIIDQNIDNLENTLNYKPSTSVADGVRNFVRWYKDYFKK